MTAKIQPTLAVGGALLLLGMLSCSKPPADAPYDLARAEAEIRDIELAWANVAVSGDPAVIEQIFADDFGRISPDGAQYTKQGFIDDTKTNPLGFTSIELNDMKVRFLGNVAIAQGQETFTRRDGERGRFVWTDVLWKIARDMDNSDRSAMQATRGTS